MAGQVKKNGEVLKLHDESGRPLWAGYRTGRRGSGRGSTGRRKSGPTENRSQSPSRVLTGGMILKAFCFRRRPFLWLFSHNEWVFFVFLIHQLFLSPFLRAHPALSQPLGARTLSDAINSVRQERCPKKGTGENPLRHARSSAPGVHECSMRECRGVLASCWK